MNKVIILVDFYNFLILSYYKNYKCIDIELYCYLFIWYIEYLKRYINLLNKNLYVIICFDDKSSWRCDLYSGYKENRKDREVDENLKKLLSNVGILKDFLKKFGINYCFYSNMEADDLIYLLVYRFKSSDVFIVSNDSDLLQCKFINDKVKLFDIRYMKFSNVCIDEVKKIILKKLIYGDKSDNIGNILGLDGRSAGKKLRCIKSYEDLTNFVNENGVKDRYELNKKLILFDVVNYGSDVIDYINKLVLNEYYLNLDIIRSSVYSKMFKF